MMAALFKWLAQWALKAGANWLAGFLLYYYRKWMRELAKERKEIRRALMRRMTRQEVHDWNARAIIESAGWVGGSYTERDIRETALNAHADQFREPQIAFMKQRIEETADDEFTL